MSNKHHRHKIDIHTHVIPEHLPKWAEKFGYGGFIRLEHHSCGARMIIDDKHFRDIESNCWDANVRIIECDNTGVNVQVLSTIPVMFNYWARPRDTYDIARFLNDHIAGICHMYPTRFIGLGTLPMQDTALAIKELERCVNDLGLPGIQIGTNVNQANLNEPAFFEIFKACCDLGAAVFVHPWDMLGKEELKQYWMPWLVGMPAETSRAICSMIFGGVFERLPGLRVCFSHGGGSFPATLGRIEHGFLARPDLVAVDNPINPRSYIDRFYIDSLVHDPLALDYILKLFGDSKICMGSDYPFPLGEQEPGKLIESMEWAADVKDRLLWKNALAWLNREDFFII